MAYCIHCGVEIGANSRFCPQCGANQAGSTFSAAQGTAAGAPSSSLSRTLGIVGSAVLFIGVFAPIVSIPIAGNQNYFQNGKGDGVVLLLLAGISLALLLANKIRRLIWTGAAALAVLLFTFVNFQYRMADLRESMEAELAGNPFAGLADMAIQSVQLQWGWAVLAVGAGLLIGAGVTAPDDAAFDIA